MPAFVVRKASRTYGASSLQGMRHEDVRQLLAQQLPLIRPAAATLRLLDVGCGRGELLGALTPHRWDLHGCDWLAATPDSAPYSYRQVDLNRRGLADYTDGSFDALLCSDVIEHLESPAMMLREFARVLTHQGRLILSFPNSWNIFERLRYLLTANFRRFKSERLSGPWGHISFFTPQIFESLCDRAGLEIMALCGGHRSGHLAIGGYYAAVPPTTLLTYNVYAVLRRKPAPTQVAA